MGGVKGVQTAYGLRYHLDGTNRTGNVECISDDNHFNPPKRPNIASVSDYVLQAKGWRWTIGELRFQGFIRQDRRGQAQDG